MTIRAMKAYMMPEVCFDSSVSDRIPSVVFSARRRKDIAAEAPCARRKPATEAMWANRNQLYMPRDYGKRGRQAAAGNGREVAIDAAAWRAAPASTARESRSAR